MGLTPERPKVDATADFVSKYFGVPKDSQRATGKFYAVYNGLRSDMDIIEKYAEKIKKDVDAGRNPDPRIQKLYEDAIDNSADQIEAYEVLKKYGKDFAELREQEMDIVWDRDTTMIPALSGDVEGNTTKRKMLRDIKEKKAMIAKEALTELQGLPQGTAIMDTYSIPFGMLVQPFVDMLPAKRDKGATYDKSLDTRRLDDLPNTEEGTVTDVEYVPLTNIQNMEVPTPVIETIIATAQENDINPNTALVIAAMESGSQLDADAEAKTSSASGVFQITKPTWKGMLEKGIGKEYDIDKSASILSPVDNIRMGILLMKEDGDKAVMELGRDINLIEQYALHHLGYTGGVNFIEAKDTAPYTPITDVISSSAYKANPQFKHPTKNRPMTVGEVHKMWVQRANEKYAELTEEYP
jgi:hypothetical protein